MDELRLSVTGSLAPRHRLQPVGSPIRPRAGLGALHTALKAARRASTGQTTVTAARLMQRKAWAAGPAGSAAVEVSVSVSVEASTVAGLSLDDAIRQLSRPGSALSRPGSAASRPDSAASRPGSARSRPGSARSARSAQSDPTSAEDDEDEQPPAQPAAPVSPVKRPARRRPRRRRASSVDPAAARRAAPEVVVAVKPKPKPKPKRTDSGLEALRAQGVIVRIGVPAAPPAAARYPEREFPDVDVAAERAKAMRRIAEQKKHAQLQAQLQAQRDRSRRRAKAGRFSEEKLEEERRRAAERVESKRSDYQRRLDEAEERKREKEAAAARRQEQQAQRQRRRAEVYAINRIMREYQQERMAEYVAARSSSGVGSGASASASASAAEAVEAPTAKEAGGEAPVPVERAVAAV